MSKVLTAEARAAIGESFLEIVEAGLEFSNSDVCSLLSSELRDMFPGEYAYLEAVFGDDESGDVVYCCGGAKYRAPYEIGSVNGKVTCAIDDDEAIEVVCQSSYVPVADDDDFVAGDVGESLKTTVGEALKTGVIFERFPDSKAWQVPVSERFISKKERDAADDSDFAGKGRSYPILKPSDVMAAVRSMGRAGSDNKSMSALKSSIIRIAKRKGWTKYLPKSWQSGGDSDNSEANRGSAAGTLKLVESSNWPKEEALHLIEAAGAVRMPIKLIAPGKGSSAFYPAEVLKRDGPKVFTKGTHIYINHATSAEEAARPEGDWHKLAGALESDSYWDEHGSKGAGLYGSALFTSDYAPLVKEKAAFTGMSIRASGIAEAGKQKDGLPVLKELVSAESVDVVTRPGAGGMILSESARDAQITRQEGDMSPEEIKKLVEAGVREANAPLVEKLLKADAREEARHLLSEVALPEPAKERVIARVLERLPMKDGALDTEAFGKLLVAEAKDMASFLGQVSPSGRVVGMGASSLFAESAEPLDKAARKKLKEAKRKEKDERKDQVNVFESLMGNRDAAKIAVMKGVA